MIIEIMGVVNSILFSEAPCKFGQFLKNVLWVRVMSVKVYIFGKEINRIIYLWPRIYHKSCIFE